MMLWSHWGSTGVHGCEARENLRREGGLRYRWGGDEDGIEEIHMYDMYDI